MILWSQPDLIFTNSECFIVAPGKTGGYYGRKKPSQRGENGQKVQEFTPFGQTGISARNRTVSIAALVFVALAVAVLFFFLDRANDEVKKGQRALADADRIDNTFSNRYSSFTDHSLDEIKGLMVKTKQSYAALCFGAAKNMKIFAWISFAIVMVYAGFLQYQKRRKNVGRSTKIVTVVVSSALPLVLILALLIIKQFTGLFSK